MERHLADMFAVSVSTVSRIHITWVRFLALTFKGSILRWPSKGEIKSHIPSSFSKYPDTRVIIDCTEFFVGASASTISGIYLSTCHVSRGLLGEIG